MIQVIKLVQNDAETAIINILFMLKKIEETASIIRDMEEC